MKVKFSCVMDNSPKYIYQAMIWAHSVIELGGIAPNDVVVHVIRGTNPDRYKKLQTKGVHIIVCDTFDTRHACSNKLAQLTTPALFEADYVVLCDCDIAIARNIDAWLQGEKVRALSVFHPNPNHEEWCRIFRLMGFDERPKPYASSITPGKTYYNNCNGGIYILPQKIFSLLANLWIVWDKYLLDHPSVLGHRKYYTDQCSFALAMHELSEEVDHLPLTMNFPTPTNITEVAHQISERPYVLHHSSRFDAFKYLLVVNHPLVDQAIFDVNKMIRRCQISGTDYKK